MLANLNFLVSRFRLTLLLRRVLDVNAHERDAVLRQGGR